MAEGQKSNIQLAWERNGVVFVAILVVGAFAGGFGAASAIGKVGFQECEYSGYTPNTDIIDYGVSGGFVARVPSDWVKDGKLVGPDPDCAKCDVDCDAECPTDCARCREPVPPPGCVVSGWRRQVGDKNGGRQVQAVVTDCTVCAITDRHNSGAGAKCDYGGIDNCDKGSCSPYMHLTDPGKNGSNGYCQGTLVCR